MVLWRDLFLMSEVPLFLMSEVPLFLMSEVHGFKRYLANLDGVALLGDLATTHA